MKFNDDYFLESAGKKEEESVQSEVMLGNLHNFCIFFQIGPNAQYKRTRCQYHKVPLQTCDVSATTHLLGRTAGNTCFITLPKSAVDSGLTSRTISQ